MSEIKGYCPYLKASLQDVCAQHLQPIRWLRELFWIPACAGMTNSTERLIFTRHSRASGNPEKKNHVLTGHE